MDQTDDAPVHDLLEHVVVPVASEADARATATALEPYRPERVTGLHVVEKAGGAPDKLPLEQAEGVAADAHAAVRETFPDADDRTAYARDVVGAIVEVADELDASAIAYRPRGGSRLVQLLSGDRSRKLVDRADRPVVVLPGE